MSVTHEAGGPGTLRTNVNPTDSNPTDLNPTDLNPTDLNPTDPNPTDLNPNGARWTESVFGQLVASFSYASNPQPLPEHLRSFSELTGWPHQPGIAPSRRFVERTALLSGMLSNLTQCPVDGLDLLSERARFQRGLHRQGTVSCGGSTRLVMAADAVMAVALPRATDVEALSALFETTVSAEHGASEEIWALTASFLARLPSAHWIERAGLLGLAMTRLREVAVPTVRSPAVRCRVLGRTASTTTTTAPPVVVDLSALWAGPLCGRLLTLAGARVIKVEDLHRPDGARFGSPEFFEHLHRGQERVELDFATQRGREALCALIASSDVVIEGSRPRGLAALGINAEQMVLEGNVRAWVSITGFGRTGQHSNRVAFGDDAAVAGGLVASSGGQACFFGDAPGDPLAGMVAAAAVLLSLRSSFKHLLDVPMAAVTAAFADREDPSER